MSLRCPLAVLLLAGASALAQSTAPPKNNDAKPAAASKTALDKATLEEFVRHLMLWNKDIEVSVGNPEPGPVPGFKEVKLTASYKGQSVDEIFYVSNDGKHILRGSVYQINENPFARELGKITTDLQPSLGTPGAKVLVVVYSDFQCGYCKEEAKVLRTNLMQTFPGKVRLYFKDFPIDSIHPWARNASIAGRCVFRQNPQAFWDYHDWIFEKQAEMTPETLKQRVAEWATGRKLDIMQFNRCYDNRSTEGEINKNIAEARSLRVQSTPTLVVNGRVLAGAVPWNNLKQIIEWELDHAIKTGFEAEKCCAVTLSPLPK